MTVSTSLANGSEPAAPAHARALTMSEFLGCPLCGAALREGMEGRDVVCGGCDASYPLAKGTPVLLPPDAASRLRDLHESWERGAITPRLPYRLLTRLVSPAIHRPREEHRRCARRLAALPADAVVLDIGCGTAELGDRVTRLDIGPFAGVDVVGDAQQLPLRSGTVDGVFIHRVLEHLPRPDLAVAEIRRVLKPGGFVSAIVPFIEPYHRNPVDHLRFGRDGLRELFRDFEEESLEVSAGPTAALLWVFREYVAILTPGSNNPFIYAGVRELTGWVVSPLVLLDRLLRRKRYAHKIACELWYVGRAPQDGVEGTGAG